MTKMAIGLKCLLVQARNCSMDRALSGIHHYHANFHGEDKEATTVGLVVVVPEAPCSLGCALFGIHLWNGNFSGEDDVLAVGLVVSVPQAPGKY